MLKQVQHDSMHNVILNLVQDLSAEKVKKKARSEMLKRVQHDSMHNVILNLVQDLTE